MRDIKRVEIVIDKLHEHKVRDLLRDVGVAGWTVLEPVSGHGDRGDRDGGELSDAMVGRYLLTTCEESKIDQLAQRLEPLLRKYGGLCLISDAKLIRND